MENKFDILKLDLNNRHIGCVFNEVNRIVTDVSGLSDGTPSASEKEKNVYKLGELLDIPGKVDYNSLLVIGSNVKKHIFVAVPDITDVLTLHLPQVMVVPDYIRRKQNPFVVWGFVKYEDIMIMLITFTYFFKAYYKDG